MSASLSLLILAIVLANCPFFIQRSLVLFWIRRADKKSFWFVLLDLCFTYVIFMGIAQWLEYQQGSIFPKTVDLYVITFSLFVVFAYPGYVYRYLYVKKA